MRKLKWAIEAASMAVIGLVLALMGPFGTFALPLDPPAARTVELTPEPERTIDAMIQQVTRPRFLARLPIGHRDGLIAVESEDRYVRVHNRAGSTLVLLRLADAVAELEGIDGLRIHRSWWVARDAVAEVLRRDRAISLRLVNGIEAPVARNAVPALWTAGWLIT